jgi:hypothetical protein
MYTQASDVLTISRFEPKVLHSQSPKNPVLKCYQQTTVKVVSRLDLMQCCQNATYQTQ